MRSVVGQMKAALKRLPIVGPVLGQTWSALARWRFPGSAAYWERRYASGGTSGAGSYGVVATFKARVVNELVKQHDVRSVIEFGCGDGNQLSLAEYPVYIGLDVSKTAVRLCEERFREDKTKSFFLYDPETFVDNHHLFRAELALSLDVIYHLIEDRVFESYMAHLFASAEKLVVIYSTDVDSMGAAPHVRHRRFTEYVEARFPNWRLEKVVNNRYPGQPPCDFYVYKRLEGSSCPKKLELLPKAGPATSGDTGARGAHP